MGRVLVDDLESEGNSRAARYNGIRTIRSKDAPAAGRHFGTSARLARHLRCLVN